MRSRRATAGGADGPAPSRVVCAPFDQYFARGIKVRGDGGVEIV